MLQAFCDDSGNTGQGNTYLFAGYVASTEVWADFSQRWDAVLKSEPSIQYLKMTEATNLKKEFQGWTPTDRDRKVHALIDVITSTKLDYYAASVLINPDHRALSRFLSEAELAWATPFFLLYRLFIKICLNHQFESDLREQVDFIFDEASPKADELKITNAIMMPSAPRSLRDMNLMPNEPVFRNDKCVRPLQAADMLANQLRNFCEWKSGKTRREPQFLNRLTSVSVPFVRLEYNAKTLGKLISETRDVLSGGPPETLEHRRRALRVALDSLQPRRRADESN